MQANAPHRPNRAPRTNESFFADLERWWAAARLLLPAEHRTADSFLSRFPAEWRARTPHHLLPVDYQPKNILVAPSGIVTIDPEYVWGPPGLAVASFLVTLESDIRGLMLRHTEFAEALKTAFLEGVGFGAPGGVSAMDLDFFYSWTLLDQLRRARSDRRHLYELARVWFSAVLRQHLRGPTHAR
jgi:hypothetical protein